MHELAIKPIDHGMPDLVYFHALEAVDRARDLSGRHLSDDETLNIAQSFAYRDCMERIQPHIEIKARLRDSCVVSPNLQLGADGIEVTAFPHELPESLKQADAMQDEMIAAIRREYSILGT